MATAQQFLAEIAADPTKLGLFLKNPDAALDSGGVAGDDRKAVKMSVCKEAHGKLFVWADDHPAFIWGSDAFVW